MKDLSSEAPQTICWNVVVHYKRNEMKKLLLVCLTLISFTTYSQNKKTDKILEEGKLLFRLEKGSWYGTDHFLENFPTKRDSIGGYVSYETSDNKINTIFFNRFDSNVILVHYQFDNVRSEEHTSELQSRENLVCRLLLE